LLTADAAALDPLLAAANGDRPEPAERAVWILQKRAQNADPEAAMAALGRLTQLSGRPQVAANAESQLGQLSLQLCQRRLTALGAECTLVADVVSFTGVGTILHVRLGEKWRGTIDDLRPLAELHQQQYLRLEGAAIDDAVVKLFEPRRELARLELWNTRVRVAAIDSLKARHPNAEIYVRNRALMGVACQNHALGALVVRVSPDTAAHAAGIEEQDVITAIDGEKVPDFDRLTARVAQHEPGDTIELDILRNGETLSVSLTLRSWEEYQAR
jgi:hypothetical protein